MDAVRPTAGRLFKLLGTAAVPLISSDKNKDMTDEQNCGSCQSPIVKRLEVRRLWRAASVTHAGKPMTEKCD